MPRATSRSKVKRASSSRLSSTCTWPARTMSGVAAVGDDREPVPAEREVALVRLHGGHDHALAAARGSARRTSPRGRTAARPGARPRRASRRGRSSSPSASSAVDDRRRRTAASGSTPALRSDVHVFAGVRDRHAPGWKRCPNETRPRLEPFERDATVSLSSLASEPADGTRETEAVRLPDHRLAEGEAAHDCGSRSGSASATARRARDAEDAVALLELLADDDRAGARNPRRAFVGARRAGGPLTHCVGAVALGQLLDEDREPPRTDVDVRRLGAEQRARQAPAAAPRPRGRRRPAAPRSRSRSSRSGLASSPMLLDVQTRHRRARGCGRGRCRPRAR